MPTPWDRVAERTVEADKTLRPRRPAPVPTPPTPPPSPPTPVPAGVFTPTPQPVRRAEPTAGPQPGGFLERFLGQAAQVADAGLEAAQFLDTVLGRAVDIPGGYPEETPLSQRAIPIGKEGILALESMQQAGQSFVPAELQAGVRFDPAGAARSFQESGLAGFIPGRDIAESFTEEGAARFQADVEANRAANEAGRETLKLLVSMGMSPRDAELALAEQLQTRPLGAQLAGAVIDPFLGVAAVKGGLTAGRAGLRAGRNVARVERAFAAGLRSEEEILAELQRVQRSIDRYSGELGRSSRPQSLGGTGGGVDYPEATSPAAIRQWARRDEQLKREGELLRELEAVRRPAIPAEGAGLGALSGPTRGDVAPQNVGMAPGTTVQPGLPGEVGPPGPLQPSFADRGLSQEPVPLIDAERILSQAEEAKRLEDARQAGQQGFEGLPGLPVEQPVDRIESLSLRIYELSAEIEALGQAPRIRRPRWAVGMSNDTLRQLAEHEGLNPYQPDWFDAIDKKLISQFRREPPSGSRQPTVQELRQERRLLREQLKSAEQEGIGKATPTGAGGSLRIMGRDTTLANSEIVDGIRYELYTGLDADDFGGYIRVMDEESKNVVTLKRHPDQFDAIGEYDDAVHRAYGGGPLAQALDAPVHGLDDIADVPPAGGGGAVGTGDPPPGLPPTGPNGEPPFNPGDAIAWFRRFLASPQRVDEWALTKEWRRRARAGRAMEYEVRAKELVDSGLDAEQAMRQTAQETLSGSLPTVPTGIHAVAEPIIRQALFQRLYQHQFATNQAFEQQATLRALTNALAGRPIPRDPGTAGRSAFVRLTEVFGDDIVAGLDNKLTLGETIGLKMPRTRAGGARGGRGGGGDVPPTGPSERLPLPPARGFGETTQQALDRPAGMALDPARTPSRLEPPLELRELPPDFRTDTEKALYHLAFRQMVEHPPPGVTPEQMRHLASLRGNEFFQEVRRLSPPGEWIEYPRLAFGEPVQQALQREAGLALDPQGRSLVLEGPVTAREPFVPDPRTPMEIGGEPELYLDAFETLTANQLPEIKALSQAERTRLAKLPVPEFIREIARITRREQGLIADFDTLHFNPQAVPARDVLPGPSRTLTTPEKWADQTRRFVAHMRAENRLQMNGLDMAKDFAKSLGLTTLDFGNLLRSHKSSFDISWLRQQAFLIIGNVPQFRRGMIAFFKGGLSETVARQYSRVRESTEAWKLYNDLKLDFLRPLDGQEAQRWRKFEEGVSGSALSRQSEEFPGLGGERPLQRLQEKLPWIKVSGRAHISGLNEMNFAMFEDHLKGLNRYMERYAAGDVKDAVKFIWRKGEKLPRIKKVPAGPLNIRKEMLAYGKMIEDMTGRAQLGRLRELSPAINAGVFSFRLALGRVLTPRHLFSGTARSRKEAWKNVLSTITAGTGVLFAGERMGLWTVETDRRSADFMKILLGGGRIRIDPWGGYQQFVVFLSRILPLIGGTKSSVTGEVTEDIDEFSLSSNLARGKASPLASLLIEAKTGKTYTGETVKLDDVDQWLNRTLQFSLDDIREVWLAEGAKGLPAAAPGVFGAGVLVYDLPRWPELDEYYQLKGREPLTAWDKPPSTSTLREDYRKSNPEADARLFVRGDVTTLLSSQARRLVDPIMREHRVDPRDVPGYEKTFGRTTLGPERGELSEEPTFTPSFRPALTWERLDPQLPASVKGGLRHLWYPDPGAKSKPLTEEQKAKLRPFFKQFPLGQTNFETWYKQTLKQLEASSR